MNKQAKAKIHSLDGAFDTVTILEEQGNNHVVAEYKGKKCTAVYNPFICCYFVDDVYGVIEDVK